MTTAPARPGSSGGRRRQIRSAPTAARATVLATVLAAVLGLAGLITLLLGLTGNHGVTHPTPPGHPPVAAAGTIPPAAGPATPPTAGLTAPSTTPAHTGTTTPGTTTAGAASTGAGRVGAPAPAPAPPPVLPASAPVSLRIPVIGVSTTLVRLGLNPDHTVQVPTDFARAGWYTGSPTPGELGPAVILGHIDSYRGPAVFYRLDHLHPGDTVEVTRVDGSVARFVVDAIREYPKDHFATHDVYGTIDYAGLRLITCGGRFDTAHHNYLDNIVVYAHLAPAPPAPLAPPAGNPIPVTRQPS